MCGSVQFNLECVIFIKKRTNRGALLPEKPPSVSSMFCYLNIEWSNQQKRKEWHTLLL
jgi:hypothetical protein